MMSFASYRSRISRSAILASILTAPVAAANLGGAVTYKTPTMARSEPLSDALVSVYETTTRGKVVTRTNKQGTYLFRIPAGRYVIIIERNGKRLYQGRTDLQETGKRLDIEL